MSADRMPATFAPLTLPPPTFDAALCAAGSIEGTGCRRCVEACPYLALRPIVTPAGTAIHVDAGLCRRCGACSAVCPTGALDRSFLQDEELMALLSETMARAQPGAILVLAGAEQRDVLADLTLTRSMAALTLPTLLVLNENHLLHAACQGAAGIAVVGGLFSHHGAPALVQDSLALSEALGGVPTAYVEAGDAAHVAAALAAFAASLPTAGPQPEPSPVPTGRRREQLAALLGGEAVAETAVAEAAFGQVMVDDDGCTLCGGCARACPTDALSFDMEAGALSFQPLACVGCGLCEGACPERVLSFAAGLAAGVDLAASQTLIEDDVVACAVCGAPHLPERLLRTVRELLAARTDLPPEAAEVDRCPACRVAGVRRPAAGDGHGSDVSFVWLPVRDHPAATGSCGCGGACSCGGSGGGCGGSGGACTCGSSHVAADRTAVPSEAAAPERAAGVERAPGPERAPEAGGVGRRSFLKGLSTAMGGLAALVSGEAKAQSVTDADEPLPPPTRRMAMAIDLDKCIGCHACTVACKAENDVPLGAFRDWVEEHILGVYPTARPYFLPKLCNHCDDPGCLRACPTGAIFRRDDGIVDLNPDICIGCRACNQACPYGMTFMNDARGTADKCNFCTHRVDDGLNPACVDVCPARCRIFGDLNDPESPVSEYVREHQTQVLRRGRGLGPNIYYVSLPAELNR